MDSSQSNAGFDLNKDLASGFASRLIRRKAKQLVRKVGFTSSDHPDLEQEMRIALVTRFNKFDPTKSHWNAFATTVIERWVATYLEKRGTKKRRHERRVVSLSAPVLNEDGEWTELSELVSQHEKSAIHGIYRDEFAEVDTAIDVARVMLQLTPDQRDLCERLMYDTPSELARDLGIAQSTLCERISKLREVFRAAGLKKFPESSVNVTEKPVGNRGGDQ